MCEVTGLGLTVVGFIIVCDQRSSEVPAWRCRWSKECHPAMIASLNEHTTLRTAHSNRALKQCPHQPTMTSLMGNLGRAKKRAFSIKLLWLCVCQYEDDKWIWPLWCVLNSKIPPSVETLEPHIGQRWTENPKNKSVSSQKCVRNNLVLGRKKKIHLINQTIKCIHSIFWVAVFSGTR